MVVSATLATVGGAAPADVTPNAVNWPDISATASGATGTQTIDGINTAITISASDSGAIGVLSYSVAGASFTAYSGPFSISDGETLNWYVSTINNDAIGTITVSNDSDAGATLDTFNYNITAAGGI